RFGNFANNDNADVVTLSVATGPGGFDPAGTTTAAVVNGVATFGNLVLDTGGSYTLGEAGTGGMSGPASAAFTVTPAAAASLDFFPQPTTTTAGAAVSPAVTDPLFDHFGNLATNDNTDQVTVSATGPGGFDAA